MLALVLSRADIREFDQMVSLYTREAGKIEALAKGIKKITSKNSSNLEVFSIVDIEVAPGKEINHLTKVQPVTLFRHIFIDLDKLLLAGYAIKIANANILVGATDRQLFDFLVGFLKFLDTASGVNALQLATAFIFKLWHYLGFSVEEKQYAQWLEGDWQTINNLVLTENDRQKAYTVAHSFAQIHSGARLAKFIEHGRII